MQSRTYFFILISIPILFLHTDHSNAQIRNQLQLSFRQDFSSYIWRTRFFYLIPINPNQSLTISEIYNSDLLESTLNTDKWKDDQFFTSQYTYRIKPWITGAAFLKSKIFYDKQTGIVNNTNSHQFGIGWILQPTRKFEVKNYTGWKSDQRFGQTQRGFFFQVESSSLPFKVADYTNNYSLEFKNDFAQDRNNRDYQLNYQVSRKFYANTSDSLSFRSGYRRINYFISKTGNLETRVEKETDFSNRLNYQVSNHIIWKLYTRLFSRTSKVDQIIDEEATGRREREDTETEWRSQIRWQSTNLNFGFGGGYRNRSQAYQSSETITPTPYIGSIGIPDNRGLLYSMNSFVNWKLTSKDLIAARITISRLQYDTPDSTNFDDRDEFRTNFLITFTRRISPFLKIGIDSKAYLHHLSYLFSERSANNNWNRIIQLGTFLKYNNLKNFQWSQRAEVQANYTEFDFEKTQFLVRSFVYRKFTLTDSLALGTYGKFHIQLFHRLELEESGRLFWKDFSEQLSLNRRNHQLTLGCEYPIIGNLMAYTGLTAYIRREWRYRFQTTGKQSREKIKDFTSYGPYLKLFLRNNKKRRALFSLSRLKISTPSGQTYTINRIELNTHWFF